MKQTVFNSLRHLRQFIGLGQKEIADRAGCSRHAIESIEQGRLRLSTSLGFKISQATGCDFGWLMSNDESLLMINHEGQPYTKGDFELARDEELESLRFYRVEPEMEIGVAYGLLCRVLQAARARDVKDVVDFQKRLEWYVRSEVGHFRELQDAVYGEIQQWNRENVGTGKSYPKTFLFPRSAKPFELGQRKFDEAIAAIADRKKRMAGQLMFTPPPPRRLKAIKK